MLTPQKPSILESQSAPLLCYKIKDHGLANTQKPPILDIFGLYLVRSNGGPNVEQEVHETLHFGKGIDFVEIRLAILDILD